MKESGEMYLEAILVLEKEKGNVRAIDVAEHMNYSKPSVSRALGKLREDGCITVDPEGYLKFTRLGREIAEKIYERHVILSDLLIRIGVSETTALEDACRIEHYISDETFNAVKKHLKEHR